MSPKLHRRDFLRCAALTAAIALPAQTKRRLKVGHTGITWGFQPGDATTAIRDVASLGYQGYESFGNVLEAWKPKGGLSKVLDENHHLPLIAAYCDVNLTDPTKRSEEVAQAVLWANLIRQSGGVAAVIGPNGVKRASFDFAASKTQIVSALNEICKAVDGAGITPVLHPHTGTCIGTRDEIYAVLDAVDTRYMKFGPDVGQLASGGSDPVKVVKDYLPLIRHVHLKDWNGGANWAGYCPLGQGKVDFVSLFALLEQAPDLKIMMVELDPGTNPPITPLETARISKEYLQKQGYAFLPDAR